MSRQAPILVIGSNCFTGSHFVDALLEDPDQFVVGVSRSPEKAAFYLPYKGRPRRNFEFYQVDLARQPGLLQSLLDELQPSVVINVAALSEVGLSNFSPVEYFQTNTVGVVTLCNFLRSRPYLKRYLHISSAEIYGSCDRPVLETDPFRPSTPYAVSKAAADLYLATLVKNFNFPVVTVRSTNVYGRHQQLYKIIPRTIISIKQGKKVQLHGGGKSAKSFVHIRDLVRGGLMAMRSAAPPGAVYHFSVPSERTISDLVRRIGELMGKRFEEIAEPVEERLGQDSRYLLDCTKAKKELGWEPQVPFDQGLKEVIEWLESSWDQVANEPLVYEHKV